MKQYLLVGEYDISRGKTLHVVVCNIATRGTNLVITVDQQEKGKIFRKLTIRATCIRDIDNNYAVVFTIVQYFEVF